MQMCVFLEAAKFPPDVYGTVAFDYFKEILPPASKGIYKILAQGKDIKYIGSSCDINKRLLCHLKKGLLEPGDTILAVVFDHNARQTKILDYERFLIGKISPPHNKHTGAPGRSWRAEQMSKLQTFSDHNWHLLDSQGQKLVSNILKGKVYSEDIKMTKSLLRIMKLFR